MKTILSYLILTFCACSFAQPHTIDYKKDRLMQTNFNGPIKNSKIQYSFFNLFTYSNLDDDKIIQNEKAIIGIVNVKFDREGKLIWYQWYYSKNQDDPTNSFIYTDYKYDKLKVPSDKIEFINNSTEYPVYNNLFKIKHTNIGSQRNRYYEKNSIVDYKKDSTHLYYHKYLYTIDDNDRINEEQLYVLLSEFKDVADAGDIEAYTHSYTIKYNYDNAGRLINQYVVEGKGPGKKNFMYGAEKSRIPFHAMGTESGFCEDLHFSYQYDAKDRITDIVFFGCNDTLAKEHYTYDEKAGYLNKIRKYTGGIGGPVSVPKTVDLFYDEHANVIKREFIQPSHHTFSFNDIPQTTYYKYDYDKYNNWIKCYIYYTGKPEGEPTAVVERKIEYYEE